MLQCLVRAPYVALSESVDVVENARTLVLGALCARVIVELGADNDLNTEGLRAFIMRECVE